MASIIQCANDACRRNFIVPWNKKDELMNCPFCSQPVFTDREALVHTEEGTAPESIPQIVTSYKTSKLELPCVGNAGAGYIQAQVGVMWHKPIPDDLNHKLLMEGKWLPIRKFYRKERINYCKFEVPEGYLCWYHRHAQIKPRIEERRCFYMNDSQFFDLGEVTGMLTFELVQRFYPQYRNWNISISG